MTAFQEDHLVANSDLPELSKLQEKLNQADFQKFPQMKVSFEGIFLSFVNSPIYPGQTDRPSEPHAGRGHLRADGHRAAQRHRPGHPGRSLRRRQRPSVSIRVREVRR